MKKVLFGKKLAAVVLSVIMLVTVLMPAASAVGAWLDETLLMKDRYVTSDNSYGLVGGVTERHVVLNNAKKNNQIKGYAMEVDINNPDLFVKVGYNDGDMNGWKATTVKSQSAVFESKGYNVVGAVNGGPFNTSGGEPAGVLVMDGVQGHSGSKYPFFAILNDGTAVIRDYTGTTEDVKEAVAGMTILVVDGEIVDHTADTAIHPRTAVGIKADGSLVFFVADGRQKPETVGMTYTDLAHTMLALGSVNAMALDGGGSSIMLTQREATEDLVVRSSPSYAKIERPVATSIQICTNAKPSGVYDHVAFTIDKIFCAPLTPTSFGISGVDVNGFKTAMPEGGYLEVADSSYGSIEGTTFMPSMKTGKTAINYVVDGEVVASVPVEISNEADNLIEKFFNEIIQAFMNIFNLMQTLIEKLGERM